MSRRMPLWPHAPDTVPQAEEHAGDTAWQQFQDLSGQLDAQFAATQPLDQAPDPAVPAPPGGSAPATIEAAMEMARRYNRVCPLPLPWQRLHALLPPRPAGPVPPPVDAASWHRTSALDKRLVLRAQLEWAALSGCLPAVVQLLASLPEGDWHHMGQ